MDDTTLFRIKEGDEGAVPGPLRDWPFQLVRILAAKHHSDRETAKARSHSFWTAIFAGVIGAFLGALFTALVTLG